MHHGEMLTACLLMACAALAVAVFGLCLFLNTAWTTSGYYKALYDIALAQRDSAREELASLRRRIKAALGDEGDEEEE